MLRKIEQKERQSSLETQLCRSLFCLEDSSNSFGHSSFSEATIGFLHTALLAWPRAVYPFGFHSVVIPTKKQKSSPF